MILKDKLIKLLDDRLDIVYTNTNQKELEAIADEIIELFVNSIEKLEFKIEDNNLGHYHWQPVAYLKV